MGGSGAQARQTAASADSSSRHSHPGNLDLKDGLHPLAMSDHLPHWVFVCQHCFDLIALLVADGKWLRYCGVVSDGSQAMH